MIKSRLYSNTYALSLNGPDDTVVVRGAHSSRTVVVALTADTERGSKMKRSLWGIRRQSRNTLYRTLLQRITCYYYYAERLV